MPDQAATSVLTLEIERAEDAAVVRCQGKLVAGVNDFLYTEVSQVIPNTKRIVLDLTDLTHMDSMGLGTLVRLYLNEMGRLRFRTNQPRQTDSPAYWNDQSPVGIHGRRGKRHPNALIREYTSWVGRTPPSAPDPWVSKLVRLLGYR